MFNMVQKILVYKVYDEQLKLMIVKGEVIKIILEDICKKYDDVFKGFG